MYGTKIRMTVFAALNQLFDYAGIFPPARLSIEDALEKFVEIRHGEFGWLVRRFVISAHRLEEFARLAPNYQSPDEDRWELTVVCTSEPAQDDQMIEKFASQWSDRFRVASVERRLEYPGKATRPTYFEVSADSNLAFDVRTIRQNSHFAKLRTGGMTPQDYPSFGMLGSFLKHCVGSDLPFKLTAGLHHPWAQIHAAHPGPDAAEVQMHGFLNVLLTTSILRNDLNARYSLNLLQESNPQSVRLDSDHLIWNQHTITAADILRGRNLFQAIGTCSLDEPIEDLQKIGWL